MKNQNKERQHSKGGKSIDQKVQLKPTALETIDYKQGSQGYSENVEAFEKEVGEQSPKTRGAYAASLAEIKLFDTRPDKWVFDKLNELRKKWGVKGGDFSPATKKWFKDHPTDLLFISEYESRTEARKWAGFKGGLKSKGGGRPKKYHTPEEKREAKKKSQQKRAKAAKGG